jgi:hypothetical protein
VHEGEALFWGYRMAEYWEKTVEWAFVRRHLVNGAAGAPLDDEKEAAGDGLFTFDGGHKWILIEFKKDWKSCKDEGPKFIALGKSAALGAQWPTKNRDCIDAYNYLINNHSSSLSKTPHIIVYGELSLVPINFLTIGASVFGGAFAEMTSMVMKQWHNITKISSLVSKNYLHLLTRAYWGSDWANPPAATPGIQPCTTTVTGFLYERLGSRCQLELDEFNKYLSYLLLAKGKKPDNGDFDYSIVMAITGSGEYSVMTLEDYCLEQQPYLIQAWNNAVQHLASIRASKPLKIK